MIARPDSWQCPWCGPGVPVDFSLPPELRLCDACYNPPACVPVVLEVQTSPIVESLRAILRNHVQAMPRTRWLGCEFGKTCIGNAILNALESHGCDKGEELKQAMIT